MSRYSYKKHGFDFGNFEITKREILVSISIIAVMLLVGVLISSKISKHQIDTNEIYNKAVKIDNTDLFQYGMDTNVGNAFVYGDLVAVDTVTYPEIGGKYMSVRKEIEEYTMHTQTVYDHDEDGNITGSHEEYYWTWDVVKSDSIDCKKVKFLGIEFNYGQIYKPSKSYIETIYDSFDSDRRYVYYGAGINYKGTIFTNLRDHTISDNTKFYNNKNIEDTVKILQSGGGVVLFWVFWIVLICSCVFGFYYLDNKWLE